MRWARPLAARLGGSPPPGRPARIRSAVGRHPGGSRVATRADRGDGGTAEVGRAGAARDASGPAAPRGRGPAGRSRRAPRRRGADPSSRTAAASTSMGTSLTTTVGASGAVAATRGRGRPPARRAPPRRRCAGTTPPRPPRMCRPARDVVDEVAQRLRHRGPRRPATNVVHLERRPPESKARRAEASVNRRRSRAPRLDVGDRARSAARAPARAGRARPP